MSGSLTQSSCDSGSGSDCELPRGHVFNGGARESHREGGSRESHGRGGAGERHEEGSAEESNMRNCDVDGPLVLPFHVYIYIYT